VFGATCSMKRRIDPALEHRSKRPAQVSDQIRQMETLADSYYSLLHFFSAPHEYSVLCDQVIECELTQLSAVLIMAAVGLRLRYSNCALGLPPRGSRQVPAPRWNAFPRNSRPRECDTFPARARLTGRVPQLAAPISQIACRTYSASINRCQFHQSGSGPKTVGRRLIQINGSSESPTIFQCKSAFHWMLWFVWKSAELPSRHSFLPSSS
jgi:hypothetical protein